MHKRGVVKKITVYLSVEQSSVFSFLLQKQQQYENACLAIY